MSGDTILPVLCGTILCSLGFLKFPTRLAEMLYPRFVVPIIFWSSTFGKFILLKPSYFEIVNQAVDAYSVDALWFANACLAAFWVGYCLPLGKWLSKFMPDISFAVNIRPSLLLVLAVALLVYNLVIPEIATSFGSVGAFLLRARNFTSLGGAALIGLAWGASRKANLGGLAIGALVLFGFSSHYMSNFSRGSGLPVLMAVFACSLVRKQLRLVPVLLAVAWTGYAGLQGLSGRGIYGHNAGLQAYWTNIRVHPVPSNFEASQLLILFHDAHSPLCVAMQAREKHSKKTGAITPAAWLLNQVPVPRFVGLPKFNVNLGGYVSGDKKTHWGYTSSMVGDLFLHLGWLGSLGFIACGIVYRLVALIAFRTWHGPQNVFDWYLVVGLVCYYALVMGMYNNYRTWVTIVFYVIYLTFALYVAIRPFAGRR